MSAPPLVDRLRRAAQLWVDATDNGSFARLGRVVVNDGGIFTRLESPGASTTTATLERFARFLADGANWPGGAVPAEVCAFAHVTGVYSEACVTSPDKGPQNIGIPAEAPSTPCGGEPSGRGAEDHPHSASAAPRYAPGAAGVAPGPVRDGAVRDVAGEPAA